VGALQQARQTEHPVPARPTLPAWIRDLEVAHASEVLRVEVTRAALRPTPGGAPNWKRWRAGPVAGNPAANPSPSMTGPKSFTVHKTGATPSNDER
jgi:hypothetical protein